MPDIHLGYIPRPWQAECHTRRARFTVLALHRRAGKTELAVLELLDNALRCDLPLPHFGYLAPFRNQAKAVAWDRLKHYARRVPVTEVNESELWVRFRHNSARVQIFGGDNPDALRGLRLDGVVVDEVANIRPELWTEVLQPALSDRKGWALFIGTPHGVNLFSELFYKAKTLPDWFSASYTVYDTNALDPDEVARLQRDMPENEFSREYLCDFSAASEDQLISLAQIEASIARGHVNEDQYSHAPRILGVDVARFGDDRSVIYPRQGIVAFHPKVFQGQDNMVFAGRVAQAIDKWKPDAVFVDIGNGSGVVDRLRQLGYPVIEVNFGARADDAGYVNKRTEMYFRLAGWLEQGGILPDRPELKGDLAAPTYTYNAQGQHVLETKEKIKKRLLRSPDESDALALTFAYPVAPRSGIGLHAAKPQYCLVEYDLFGD